MESRLGNGLVGPISKNGSARFYNFIETRYSSFAIVRALEDKAEIEGTGGIRCSREISHEIVYYPIFAIEIARFLVSRLFPRLVAYLIDTHEREYKRCKSVLTLDARTTRPTIKGTTNKSSGHRV